MDDGRILIVAGSQRFFLLDAARGRLIPYGDIRPNYLGAGRHVRVSGDKAIAWFSEPETDTVAVFGLGGVGLSGIRFDDADQRTTDYHRIRH